MKKLSLVLCLLLLMVSCSKTPTTPSTTGNIAGKVLGYTDNKPVAGAFIKTEPPSMTQLTDADGRFFMNTLAPGQYTIIATKSGYYENSAMVNVSAGNATSAIIQLKDINTFNHPPNIPSTPVPDNGIDISDTSTTLLWVCSDPDSDQITYDVYFSKINPPTNKIATTIKASQISVNNLTDSTTYYWKVVAKDIYGAITEGPVWSFRVIKFSPPPTDASLIAYYPFNGNAKDFGPNGLDGQVYGATLCADRKGKANSAYHFNGTSSYIEVPYNSLLNFSSDFTVCCWIKPDDGYGKPSKSNNVHFIGRWMGTGLLSSSWAMVINLTNNGAYDILVYDGYQNYESINNNTVIPMQSWTYLTYKREKQATKFYINGSLVRTDNSLPEPQNSLYPLYIGKHQNDVSYYNGAIDEIYIYNRALTDIEIKSLAK